MFVRDGGQYYFYHNDHLGTPQKITGVNGAVVWSAKYSSFGEAAVEVETVENNLRFPGQYFDDETGLLYNYHRYYDPRIGRYIRSDPVEHEGGDNFYIYVFNSPINQIDFLGLLSVESCPLTNCPCDGCEIFEEKDVPRKLKKPPVTDNYPILEYKIINGVLTFAVLVEGVLKVVHKMPYTRPPIVISTPQTYHVESDLWAKFDCDVEYCPVTMKREELCRKRKGSDYKIFRKDWITWGINVY